MRFYIIRRGLVLELGCKGKCLNFCGCYLILEQNVLYNCVISSACKFAGFHRSWLWQFFRCSGSLGSMTASHVHECHFETHPRLMICCYAIPWVPCEHIRWAAELKRPTKKLCIHVRSPLNNSLRVSMSEIKTRKRLHQLFFIEPAFFHLRPDERGVIWVQKILHRSKSLLLYRVTDHSSL